MRAAYILIGTTLGLIASGTILLLGATVWWAFASYIIVSTIAMLLAEGVASFFRESPDIPPDVAASRYLGNRNSRPGEYRHPLVEPKEPGWSNGSRRN